RDTQDRELAQAWVEGGAEQQVVAEPQERLGEPRMAGQRGQRGARALGVQSLLGQHHRQRPSYLVVPLVGGQWGQAHGRLSSRRSRCCCQLQLSSMRIRFSFTTNRFPSFRTMVNGNCSRVRLTRLKMLVSDI